jgi:hypothetical protein
MLRKIPAKKLELSMAVKSLTDSHTFLEAPVEWRYAVYPKRLFEPSRHAANPRCRIRSSATPTLSTVCSLVSSSSSDLGSRSSDR